MTEPAPHEVVEPKSLPDNLPPPGAFAAPNALEEASSRRTTLIAWGLVGLILLGGVAVMAMTWREAAWPAPGNWSFEAPRIELPFDEPDRPRPDANVIADAPAPEGMAVSQGRDAEPFGQSDKPAGE